MGLKLSALFVVLLAIVWSCSGASTQNPDFIPQSTRTASKNDVKDFEGRTNMERILKTIISYLIRGDFEGLYKYLTSLPEITLVLQWLKVHHYEIFKKICWLLNACDYDVEIPIEVLQRIFQYIAKKDWDGLANYLKTIDNNYLILEWIRYNFPEAWSHICQQFDPHKCPSYHHRTFRWLQYNQV